MKLPTGGMTQSIDIGFLYTWALEFKRKSEHPVLIAAIGRPTAPVYLPLKKGAESYWENLPLDSAIEYGEPQGEQEYRIKVAKALTLQYGTQFEEQNILFTVGGGMGLCAISYLIQSLFPNRKVVATLPVYPAHTGLYKSTQKPEMLLVNTLDTGTLTAENLQSCLKNVDARTIGAFIFCDPHNPMGFRVGETEWKKISTILEQYPAAVIVLDEAYAELIFNGKHESLVSASPHLKQRILLLRSATKGLSASGERMALLASWNDVFMEKLTEYQYAHVSHLPISGQCAYSHAVECFTNEDMRKLSDHYEPQVRYVEALLKKTNFLYNPIQVAAAFYVIADFKEFFGKKISPKTAKVYASQKEFIENDLDIVFHLLAEYGLGLMPLSIFGVDSKRGLLRITCSFTENEQTMLSDKIHKIRQDLLL